MPNKFANNKDLFAAATRMELYGRKDADMSKRVTSKYRTISTNELAKSSFRLTWIALKEDNTLRGLQGHWLPHASREFSQRKNRTDLTTGKAN